MKPYVQGFAAASVSWLAALGLLSLLSSLSLAPVWIAGQSGVVALGAIWRTRRRADRRGGRVPVGSAILIGHSGSPVRE